ncbi:hypothetical protein F7725_029095 [Dissostichus mawsoni]|uniref:Uncharacterized protein n=1 Tax=Dissostichus mawsoni TaxID=36200 RepID=A0A7J5XIW8_DISMA|nr:hypothetical protein F7725_029095 [Dissostichus mawsoni]
MQDHDRCNHTGVNLRYRAISTSAVVAVDTVPLSNQLFQASPLLPLPPQPHHLLLQLLLLLPPPRLLASLPPPRLPSGLPQSLPLSLLPQPLCLPPLSVLSHLQRQSVAISMSEKHSLGAGRFSSRLICFPTPQRSHPLSRGSRDVLGSRTCSCRASMEMIGFLSFFLVCPTSSTSSSITSESNSSCSIRSWRKLFTALCSSSSARQAAGGELSGLLLSPEHLRSSSSSSSSSTSSSTRSLLFSQSASRA